MENKYKNKEELYFSYYLDELIKHGIILQYEYEEHTFLLADDVKYKWTKVIELKTKTKREEKESSLLKPVTYTPDFVIKGFKLKNMPVSNLVLNEGMPLFLLSCFNGDFCSFIDVKGMFAGRTNSTQYTFPIKQKWMHAKHDIYVQKIIPEKLFKSTFTPWKVITEEVYKKANSKKGINVGDTKLKYKPTIIEEWIDNGYKPNK